MGPRLAATASYWLCERGGGGGAQKEGHSLTKDWHTKLYDDSQQSRLPNYKVTGVFHDKMIHNQRSAFCFLTHSFLLVRVAFNGLPGMRSTRGLVWSILFAKKIKMDLVPLLQSQRQWLVLSLQYLKPPLIRLSDLSGIVRYILVVSPL